MPPLGLSSLLAVISLLVAWVSSIDPDDRDPKDLVASELLEMIPAGHKGSCADESMDQLLQDTAQLAQNAVDAIGKIVHGDIENNDDNEKILNMAYISFGVKYDLGFDCQAGNLVITDGMDRLMTAYYNFQFAAGRLKMDEQLVKMECGDADLRKVTTLGDLGIEPKDKTIKTYREELDATNKLSDKHVVGYYLLQYFSPEVKPGVYDMKTVVLGASGRPATYAMSSPCQRVSGVYFPLANMIMLCPQTFKLKNLEQAMKDQDKIKWTLDTESLDDELDAQETTSAVFLHEVMHWVNYQITDVPFCPTDSNEEVFAYHSALCRQLAFNSESVEKTVINADSYKMFAKGVTFNKVNWYPKGYEENTGIK